MADMHGFGCRAMSWGFTPWVRQSPGRHREAADTGEFVLS